MQSFYSTVLLCFMSDISLQFMTLTSHSHLFLKRMSFLTWAEKFHINFFATKLAGKKATKNIEYYNNRYFSKIEYIYDTFLLTLQRDRYKNKYLKIAHNENNIFCNIVIYFLKFFPSHICIYVEFYYFNYIFCGPFSNITKAMFMMISLSAYLDLQNLSAIIREKFRSKLHDCYHKRALIK